jgi:hypothetical protein
MKNRKKWLLAAGLVLCVPAALFAEETDAETKSHSQLEERFFAGGSFGILISGNAEVDPLRPGIQGVKVRDINMKSGGESMGFIWEGFAGYQITQRWAVDLTLAIGGSSGSVPSGYKEAETFFEVGVGSKTIIDSDKLSWDGTFLSIDAGASYKLLAPKNGGFFINGKFALGSLAYQGEDESGGLKYSAIRGWSGGTSPGADYTDIPLTRPVEGFFLKPGIDVGIGSESRVQGLLNAHAKIFPAAFFSGSEAVITDGVNHRAVRRAGPQWMFLNITLGLKYYMEEKYPL